MTVRIGWKAIQLAPREKAIYREQGHQLVKQETPSVITYAAGTEYAMNFTDTPIPKIIKRIERKFNVSFVGSTETFANCRLTADLTDQSLERTLQMVTLSVDASYRIVQDKVYLEGTSCP